MDKQTFLKQQQFTYLHFIIKECREIIKKAPTTPNKVYIDESHKEPFFNLGLTLKSFLSKVDDLVSNEELATKIGVHSTTLKRIFFNYENREGYRKVTIDDFMDKVEKLVNKEFGTEEDFFNEELEVTHA